MPPVAENAPDAVETRDPRTRAVPASRSRAWLYAVPAAVLLVMGLVWMLRAERAHPGRDAPLEVTGTSGERRDDPEGAGRGDEHPLNPTAGGPSVISDMELLTAKADYAGRAVEFGAIPVVTVPGPRTFWVGRIANRTLVLVDRDAQGTTKVAPGAIIALSGRLQAPPSAAELANAGLSADDREAVQGEKVIIRATRIAPQAGAGANQAPVPAGERH
jgi:hypothetical protein